jgi:ketosteroid isomerase-like protein
MEQPLIDIVRKFIEAYNSLDIDGMLSLLHPDVDFINISGGKVDAVTKGKIEFEELARKSASLFTSREQKIISIEEAASVVKTEIEYHAVLAEDLPKGMKKGDHIEIKGRSEYNIKDNLIISIKDIS